MIQLSGIRLAINAARQSKYKHRIGAILLKKHKVVSVGFNQIKTHPFSTSPFSIHAENHVLRKSKGDTLIVIRLRKNGQLALAKPCNHCIDFIHSHNIKNIYYSNNSGNMEKYLIG